MGSIRLLLIFAIVVFLCIFVIFPYARGEKMSRVAAVIIVLLGIAVFVVSVLLPT